MSERPMKSDNPGDPRVSAAYRELADERTPEHLDHVILNAARGAATPRWNKAIAWLRPAAWVATIGVCLAIGTERLEKSRPQSAGAQKMQQLQEVESPEASDLPRRSDDADAGAAPELGESSLEDTETPVRQRTITDVQPPASILSTAPASNLAEETATERYCDESEIADPNTWLECILELEQQGFYDAARLERERLAAAFPPPELP